MLAMLEKINFRKKSGLKRPRPSRLFSPRLGYQLGVSIDNSGIKICLLKNVLHLRKVLETRTIPVKADLFDSTAAYYREIAILISDYLEMKKLSRIPVNIGLSGSDIASRRLRLPDMPPSELDKAVGWEAQKVFPFKFDECNLYHRIVDFVLLDDIRYAGINVIAIKSEYYDIIADTFRSNGLNVGQIGFLPEFIAALCRRSSDEENKQIQIILHLDNGSAYAIFCQHGHVEFFQELATPPASHPEKDGMVNLEAIASDFVSIMDLYSAQLVGRNPQNILVSGLYAGNDEILEYIGNLSGFRPERIDTNHGVPAKIGGLDPATAGRDLPAIAAAMANPEFKPLAPRKEKIAAERHRLMATATTALAIGLLVTGALQASKSLEISGIENQLNTTRRNITKIETSPGHRGYLSIIAHLNRNRQLSLEKQKKDSHFHLALKELSLKVPEKISFDAINFEEKAGEYELAIEGHVKIRDFSPEIILAQFVEALDGSPLFKDVRVLRHRKEVSHGAFNLNFQLAMDAVI